jgi:hypothetical protein
MKKPSFKDFKVRIRGRWWKVLRKAPPNAPDAVGLCDFDERTIYIRPGAEMPATIIHECIHAAIPDVDEHAVESAELAIMECMKKCNCLVGEEIDKKPVDRSDKV